MGLAVITPAAQEPITLAEARAQCRVDGTEEDTLLAIYISAARASCEGLTQRPLITRTYEQTLDAFPAEEIALRVASVQSIASVKYTDTAGAEQTINSTAYTLDGTNSLQPWLLPAVGSVWPDTEETINAVRVRFVAGFGATAADMPADVRVWLLMTVALMFNNRELVDASGKSSALPGRFVDVLLDPWRVYGA